MPIVPHDRLAALAAKAAPTRPGDEREQHANRANDQQNDADRVQVERAAAADVNSEADHSADGDQDQADSDTHLSPLLRGGELSAIAAVGGAEWPLDENEGADGDVVLVLDIPAALFVEYEHVEDEKPYREAMIPAVVLNEHRPSLRRLTEAEVDELTLRRQDYWANRLGH